MTKSHSEKTQIEKFREAAREFEIDDSEENFDRIVRKVAKSRDFAESDKKDGGDGRKKVR